MTDQDTEFDAACSHVRGLAGKLSKDDLLYFYGRYKMVTVGPCNTEKPAFYQLTEKSKWQAWMNLANMSAEKAKEEYLDKLDKLDPEWRGKDSGDPASSGWVSVSRPKNPDEDEEQNLQEAEKTIFDWTKEGRLDKLKIMLNSENVQERDSEGLTILHWAADRGLLEVCQHILSIDNSIINLQDNDGQTCLHYASCCGHGQLVKYLLSAGSDPTIADSDGVTPVSNADAKIRHLFQPGASN